MWNKNSIITLIALIVLGALLIILKSDVISFALTLIGIALILAAMIDFSQQMTHIGVVKAVAGIVVIIFGWVFVSVALYILAIVLIIQGVFQIIDTYRLRSVMPKGIRKTFSYLSPVASVLAGICLMFYQGGTISWIFVLSGLLLVIEGILSLANWKNEIS